MCERDRDRRLPQPGRRPDLDARHRRRSVVHGRMDPASTVASAPGAVWDLAVDPVTRTTARRSRDGVFMWSTGPDVGEASSSRSHRSGRSAVARRRRAPRRGRRRPTHRKLYETADATGAWTSRPFPQLRTELMTTSPAPPRGRGPLPPRREVILSCPKGMSGEHPERSPT